MSLSAAIIADKAMAMANLAVPMTQIAKSAEELLGKRTLVAVDGSLKPRCARISEFSPSGKYVNFGSCDPWVDLLGWYAADDVTLLEVLE